jgi:hypothetical protein
MEEIYGKQKLESMTPDQLYGEYKNFIAVAKSN